MTEAGGWSQELEARIQKLEFRIVLNFVSIANPEFRYTPPWAKSRPQHFRVANAGRSVTPLALLGPGKRPSSILSKPTAV
jgi:hypothetical protein